MSWLLRVIRPLGSTVTPSPLEPTPPSRLKPPSGGKSMVPLKPPSTGGGQTMILQMSTLFPPPSEPLPPSPLPLLPPSPPGGVTTTGNRETSPLQVHPEAAVIAAAATSRNGNARRVIEAVSTRGGPAQRPRWAPDGSSGEESSGGHLGRSTLERLRR